MKIHIHFIFKTINISILFLSLLYIFFLKNIIVLAHIILLKIYKYVSLEHKSSHKQHRYICSNNQQYIVWVKIIDFIL